MIPATGLQGNVPLRAGVRDGEYEFTLRLPGRLISDPGDALGERFDGAVVKVRVLEYAGLFPAPVQHPVPAPEIPVFGSGDGAPDPERRVQQFSTSAFVNPTRRFDELFDLVDVRL